MPASSEAISAMRVRRVVSGVNDDGRSCVVEDTVAAAQISLLPLGAMVDLWRPERIPVDMHAHDAPTQVDLNPPQAGLVARLFVLAPDVEWKHGVNDADVIEGFKVFGGGTALHADGSDRALDLMHTTPTVDLVYVVSGEVYAVLEDSETKLSVGDLFVQRGTKHAWSNRSSEPAVLFVVLVSAEGR